MKRVAVGITVIILVVVVALWIGRSEPAVAPDVPPGPFASVWGLGDKHVVSFSGDSAGHIAGEESEFTLELDNRAANIDDFWQLEYCVLLLDEDDVVMKVAHEEVDVPAGLKTSRTITVQFPADLDGPYGLSILVPGRGQTIQTIWIGEIEPVSAGPWPVLDTCPGG